MFQTNVLSFQLPYLLFLNVFGICHWGKGEATSTPGMSVPSRPNFAVTDLLPLKSASLDVVPFTKLGADCTPEKLYRVVLSQNCPWPWPAFLLAGFSILLCRGMFPGPDMSFFQCPHCCTQCWFLHVSFSYHLISYQWNKAALWWLQLVFIKAIWETHVFFNCLTLS